MTDRERIEEIHKMVGIMGSDIDDEQRDIYILSGVLGGIDLFLIIAIIAVIYGMFQVKKQLEEAEIEKQVEAEVNAQKYAAYTGEEVHRKMMAATTPAAPLSQGGGGKGPDSEYAFNAPFVDDRVLLTSSRPGNANSRLNRF